MKFELIAKWQQEFTVGRMCHVFGVSRSGYYAWRQRPVSAREMANQELVGEIKRVHQASRRTYGSPRVYRALRAEGIACSENRVARLMRQCRIVAKQARRFTTTTKANPRHAAAPNHLKQHFEATRPNETWLSDITYIPTEEGWLYLAAVMDIFSRRIVGWSMGKRITSRLAKQAMEMALSQRSPGPGLIHHSDRGSQYTSAPYQGLLTQHKVIPSMSASGNCYDNAPMESVFGTLKQELIYHKHYVTRRAARTDIFDYIETFYNRQRLHSSLDYQSPIAFEQAFEQQQLVPDLCPQN